MIVADGWLEAWDELLGELDAGVGERAKTQMAAEVIFLIHDDRLHEVNLGALLVPRGGSGRPGDGGPRNTPARRPAVTVRQVRKTDGPNAQTVWKTVGKIGGLP